MSRSLSALYLTTQKRLTRGSLAVSNGGPVYWTDLGPIYAHGGSANNFPLKGVSPSRLPACLFDAESTR